MNSIIHHAYNPERFRQAGHMLIDQLADLLAASQQRTATHVHPWQPPEEQFQFWQSYLQSDHNDFFSVLLEKSTNVQHPHYVGHQVTAPVPETALAGLISDLLNNGMGVYEVGQASTAIERVVVKEVAGAMGFDAEAADGFITSGGTLANLTALLAARSIKAKEEVWTRGHQEPLALLVSEQAHYCVDRAVRIMGWGEAGIIKVPTDAQYRMRTDLLEAYYQQAVAEGKQVIAVVGSACSTATGSFDDLEAIGAFCRTHDLWFHVDGAHGGASAFSDTYRHLVKGIEQADSVVMDFHKMLLTPALATLLLFRDGRHSYQTFAQKADYLFSNSEEPEWYNLAKRTFECTKFMMGVKVFTILKHHGTELWNAHVTQTFDLGKSFAKLLQEHPNFELAVEPQCNIVCFRYVQPEVEEEELNALNTAIRTAVLEDGRFYIVKTLLDGKVYLRTTLMNPFTTVEDLVKLLEFGKALLVFNAAGR